MSFIYGAFSTAQRDADMPPGLALPPLIAVSRFQCLDDVLGRVAWNTPRFDAKRVPQRDKCSLPRLVRSG